MLLSFSVLSLKKSFIVFQKRWFSVTFLTLKLLKWRILILSKYLTNSFSFVCNRTSFFAFLPLLNLLYNLDLCIIVALRRVFVMKDWLLFCTTFSGKDTNRSRVVLNGRWNYSKSNSEDKCFLVLLDTFVIKVFVTAVKYFLNADLSIVLISLDI